MKKISAPKRWAIALGLLPTYAFANYPLEFADFFSEQKKQVEVAIAGGSRNESILANISYDTFQLTHDPLTTQTLLQFLIEQKISESAAKKIVQSLQLGIDANPGCTSMLNTCIPEDKPAQAEYIFDFDAQLLKIFVSPEMMATYSDQKQYHSAARSNNALINWTNLYLSSDESGNHNFTFSNNAVLGLPLGHLSFDSQYQHQSNDFTLYKALYDVEIDNLRGILGYQAQSATPFNSTDALAYGADYSGLGFTFGSSQNLLKGNRQTQQRIQFYAPQAAQLEIYQGDRLLLTRVVTEGQQSISYDQLPSGIYTITMVLRRGDQSIFREQRQVVNTQQFSLAVNEWDYMFNAGLLEETNEFYDKNTPIEDPKINTQERLYARVGTTYRPIENALLSIGTSANVDDILLQTAGQLVYGDSLSGQYNVGYFTSNARYYSGQINYAPFSVSARRFSADTHSNFANLLYGSQDFTEIGAGVSGEALGGDAYLNYFKYQSKYNGKTLESHNITSSWSRNWLGGSVTLSAGYSQYDNKESINTSIVWSTQVSQAVSGQFAAYFDRDGFAYNRNSMNYKTNNENLSTYSTASILLDAKGSGEAEISSTVDGHNNYINYNAYGYMNDKGRRSVSGSLSGTQIISQNGAASTYKRGEAFANIQPEFEDAEKPPAIKYNMLRNNQLAYSGKWFPNTFINLTPYSLMELKLDAESENLDIENKNYRHFVMPGNYYPLNTKVTPLESRLFVLNDIFDKPVRSALCLGEGCVSIEPVSEDGIFRVNFKKGSEIKLVSMHRLCIENKKNSQKAYSQAYCLPGLDETQEMFAWEIKSKSMNKKEAKEALLYLGKYKANENTNRTLLNLKTAGLTLKSINLNKEIYVYVQYQENFTQAQRSLLDTLNAYVILDVIKAEQLFSMR